MYRTVVALAAVGIAASIKPSQSLAQPTQWATLKGRVVLADELPIPDRAEIKVDAHPDKALCLKEGKLLSEEWIVNPKNRGLKNVVVWIEPAGAKRGTPFPKNSIHPSLAKAAKKEVVIDQPCCRFIPHTVVARAGQDLVIKNSAPKPHNAKWDSANNGTFNPLLASGAEHKVEGLKPEKNPIPLQCSIHPWMKAWVYVFDHPYFAITDVDGNFEIKNAPEGAFTLYTNHESVWNNGKAGANGTRKIEIKGPTQDEGDIPFISPYLPKK